MEDPIITKPLLLGLCASVGLALVTPASAQSAPSTAGASRDAAESAMLGEIVVTAQKRSERLQDVPISITAIDANTLKAAAVEQLSDLSVVTPGLQFQQQGGFTQPMIRGVGTSNEAVGAGSNVGIYVDGFLLPNPVSSDMRLLNVANVQVLKGPQGTLFGRNTTGGAILITTSEPSLQPSARAEVSYGSHNAQSYEAYLTGGLGDRFAVDLAAMHRRGDGWLRNIVTNERAAGYEDDSVRIGAKFNFTDNAYVLLRYSHADVNDPSTVEHGVLCCNAQGRPLTSVAYVPGAVIATAPDEVSTNTPLVYKVRSNALQLTGAADLGFAKLTSYTQYRDERSPEGVDLASSSLPVETFQVLDLSEVFSQELILASKKGSKLQWTTGLFYFSNTAAETTDGSFGGGPYLRIVRNHVRIGSVAGYADLTYQVLDRLFVTAGVRVSHDTYTHAYNELGPILGGPGVVILDPIRETTATPRLVIRYKPDDKSSVYFSYTKGYKSALRNISAQRNDYIAPEKISAYEVGYKYASRAISADVSAFYYDYKDLQVQSFQGPIAIVSNAASSRIYGVEGDLHYAVSDNLELSAAGAYTDAKYNSFIGAPLYNQCLDVSCGLGSFPSVSANLSHSPMQYAPKFSGNIAATYRTDVARGRLELTGILGYTAKQYFDAAAQFSNAAHEDLTLRAEWTDPTEHYTVAVYGQNLTDKRYLTQIQPNGVAVVTSWNPPRTVGVSLGAKF